ncbi:radical SAM protein [Natranaerobius thermophilus]|uniref:Radical SAM domain protein n=1 Tax=Natranaerobius thermophilus (strain ATCC BAA-1301 / DSM 18059 / JW/NM-WN-LF) TaxID=457570 RepID=B2A6K3_NATTJ|nr:radical SAM protein [Natranaerobius thermophilus]ACB85536.1 Radical SAM domain protein [Natranaerobius thermophilus JW/NM-WN-LF]
MEQSNAKKITLIDGYVDEPSCLGVPPYISPYVRYTFGALLESGFREGQIEYLTIDQLRDDTEKLEELQTNRESIVIIAGTTVPGRYLGGRPISLKEISRVSENCRGKIYLGGPIVLCGFEIPGLDYYLDETGAFTLYELMSCSSFDKSLKSTKSLIHNRSGRLELLERFAQSGAQVLTKHPEFPFVVCELETYRGCLRQGNCNFCSESLKKILYTRTPQDISKEVSALYSHGARHFRLGAQTDLFMYGATETDLGLTPNPAVIQELYSGIRKAAPQLETLHMDNANPSTIARYPQAAREIMKTIVTYNTPGDTAAFGLESCDPEVLKQNDIGTDPQETMAAIELMNQVGGITENGVYKLLPGINLLYGLQGETSDTFDLNFNFLKEVLDRGLLLRRINLRQVREIAGYAAKKVNEKRFKQHKEMVNQEINFPMLKKVFPKKSILKNVRTEKREGYVTYGRQLGSYPILVGIPGEHPLDKFVDVKVIDHGYRSITGLKYPFNINKAQKEELRALPGIGKKRATHLFLNKPIENGNELQNLLGDSINVEEIDSLIDQY